jgi:hypothetical protein
VDRQTRSQRSLHPYCRGSAHSHLQSGDRFTDPTDIFPNINIPVIAVAWEFTGLNPEELEGQLTTVFERILTTTVDNIEHIESTPSIEFLVNPACDRSRRLGLLLDHSAPSSPVGKTTEKTAP